MLNTNVFKIIYEGSQTLCPENKNTQKDNDSTMLFNVCNIYFDSPLYYLDWRLGSVIVSIWKQDLSVVWQGTEYVYVFVVTLF